MNSRNKIKWCQQQQFQPQTKQLPQTKEVKLDNSLTLLHRGHGPRVPCRDVRIEG